MKLHKISLLMLGTLFVAASCDDIDEQIPQGGSLTLDQVVETNSATPSRSDATFSGMFSYMGKAWTGYPSSTRPDDFGFPMIALSADLEGADMAGSDNNYNWISTASELSTRNASYANPFIRYSVPYRTIGLANDILATIDEATTDSVEINKMAQARVLRAYCYMSLAPHYQFTAKENEPCIPILREGVDYTNNPRATVKDVYEYIMEDLNYGVAHLNKNRNDKAKINQQVAYGLRARANLIREQWEEAAADAEKAMAGFEPASIEEVSVPAFCDAEEHNWMWAVIITDAMAQSSSASNPSNWFTGFNLGTYAAATQNTPMINKLLWDKIPETDVRKGWWLDEDLHSPNWAGLEWDGYVGDEIAEYADAVGDKDVFRPYTNIKFGAKNGVGGTLYNNDFPLMRVEEMYLIKAEGELKSGSEGKARTTLENFVKTYRDPSYTAAAGGRTLANEIWFQRRVELWGEGFFTADAKRLGKPIVRFHGPNTTNFDDAFTFNIAADDPWLNMRFPQTERDNNLGIVDNEGGAQPEAGQLPNLRDGVTD